MKLFSVRLIPIAIITLVYLSLLVFDFLRGLRPLNPSASTFFGNSTNHPRPSPVPLGSDMSRIPQSALRSVWLQLPVWLTRHSTTHLERGLKSVPHTSLRATEIGGAWKDILPSLANISPSLPSTVAFTADEEYITPSLNNGYINSRIDLRRRRRALDPGPRKVARRASVALYIRRVDLIQPRAIDPSKLADEFKKAALHNRVLEDELAVRRLRRAKKKRKGVARRNPA